MILLYHWLFFCVLFLHLFVVIYHSRIFLAATVSQYSSAIYEFHSLHRCLLFNLSLLAHLNFWIPDRNHAYQTLLFTLQWSKYSSPPLCFISNIRLDIAIQSFFFVWLFFNIVALGFYYLTWHLLCQTKCLLAQFYVFHVAGFYLTFPFHISCFFISFIQHSIDPYKVSPSDRERHSKEVIINKSNSSFVHYVSSEEQTSCKQY